jgi:hypothetical protein
VFRAICDLQSAIYNEFGWNHEAILRPIGTRGFLVGVMNG